MANDELSGMETHLSRLKEARDSQRHLLIPFELGAPLLLWWFDAGVTGWIAYAGTWICSRLIYLYAEAIHASLYERINMQSWWLHYRLSDVDPKGQARWEKWGPIAQFDEYLINRNFPERRVDHSKGLDAEE